MKRRAFELDSECAVCLSEFVPGELLARLPAHLVAPPDLDEAAAEKFYKNKGQKAPEAERRAASKQRRAEARAQRDAKRRGAGAAPAAYFYGLGDAEDDAAPRLAWSGSCCARSCTLAAAGYKHRCTRRRIKPLE